MSEEKPEVVKFEDTAKNTVPVDGSTTGAVISLDSSDGKMVTGDPLIDPTEKKPEPELPEPTEWHGVKFPGYFKGMHFVDVKGSTVMAVDPACLTIEMKANWESVYRPELAALGRQVIEKAFDIKIELL